MSEQKLSLPDFTALVVLAVAAGEISNNDLKERFGLTIDGKKRIKLNELKLVDSWKQGRQYVHMLTDQGSARLAEDLSEGSVPALPGSAGSIARALLGWLPLYLRHSDQRLADVFQPYDDAPEDARSGGAGDAASSDAPTDFTPSGIAQPEDLEASVRAAYAELAPRPGSWVGLARLRPLLGDVPRGQVDETLIRMERLPDVNIVPESNQKTLTPGDREAGVIIGGQEKHLLWIGGA
ncbi:hypothetical protein ACTMTF_18390 [Nonomuraea sp. ZG12]|uniref:hypothetical protein n=1 Tax=Nonomuraea sp. ZG12 TaxID=3452207 RepID=UPI003F8C7095